VHKLCSERLRRVARSGQPLDHLKHEDVTEAVQPLRAGPVGGADAGLDQPGTRPVVELAVGDASGGTWGGAPVPELIEVGAGLTGRAGLLRGAGAAGNAGNLAVVKQGALRVVVTPSHRHAHLHGSELPTVLAP